MFQLNLSNPRLLLSDWLSQNGLKIECDGRFTDSNGSLRTSKSILDRIVLDVNAIPRSPGTGAPSRPLIESAINEAIEKARLDAEITLQTKLAFVRSIRDRFDELALLLVKDSKDARFVAHILRHWFWTVKRKLFNKSVFDHLFLVFLGAQGAGKSTAIKQFIRPLEGFIINVTGKTIMDDRQHLALARNFIGFFEELSGLPKAEIEALKNIITADQISVRLFHTQNVENHPQKTSFIGSSNKTLVQVVQDSTGMRRFVEIHVADRIDRNAINTFDMLELWKCVDESNESGYLPPIREELEIHQKSLTTDDSITYFIDDFEYVPALKRETFKTSKFLYEEYINCCHQNGFSNPFSHTTFSKILKSRGFKPERQRGERGFLIGKFQKERLS